MSRNFSIDATFAGVFRLGQHDVARVGYGALQLEQYAKTPEVALSLVRRAIDLGVNHFDTAEFYGDGFVNGVLGHVLRDNSDIVVATKVGAEPNPGGNIPIRAAQRPEQLRSGVEANLRSLKVDQIPIVYLRRLDVGPGLSPEGDQIVDIDDQLAAMIAMRDEGKIGAIGLSAVDLEGLKRALVAGIACVQNAYSLLSRGYETMLDVCVEHRIAWVPFFPLGGAYFPEWPKVAAEPRVIEIAARIGIEPSQLGLAWLLSHKPNILLIPGTTSALHLEANIAAASIRLTKEDLIELDAICTPTA